MSDPKEPEPNILDSLYEKPEPSLCDSCKNAYYIEGGSISIGTLTDNCKSYKQRYCSEKKIAIHMNGFNRCESYGS